MHPTTMMDLQCVDVRVDSEPMVEKTEGRGGDEACISKEEGRRCDTVEGRQGCDGVARRSPLGGAGASRGGR
jgi:hypothetical protein